MSAINALLRINNLLHLRGRNKCCLGLLHFCFCVSKKFVLLILKEKEGGAAASGEVCGKVISFGKDRELKARKDAKGREGKESFFRPSLPQISPRDYTAVSCNPIKIL